MCVLSIFACIQVDERGWVGQAPFQDTLREVYTRVLCRVFRGSEWRNHVATVCSTPMRYSLSWVQTSLRVLCV